jgi:hypothetical protein
MQPGFDQQPADLPYCSTGGHALGRLPNELLNPCFRGSCARTVPMSPASARAVANIQIDPLRIIACVLLN